MPGDPRLGIVLSGPQAPWGSPSPRGGHLRQVPPPTTTAPPLTRPRAGALRFRCPAPRRPDKGAGLAERMSLDGPNGGSGPDADRGRFGRGPDGTGGTRLGTSAPRPPSERGALPRTGRSPVRTLAAPSEPTQRCWRAPSAGPENATATTRSPSALLPLQATDHAASHYRPPARARPRRPKVARTGANPLGAPRRLSPHCSFPGCGLTGQAGLCGMGTATMGRSWWTRNWRWRSACSAR